MAVPEGDREQSDSRIADLQSRVTTNEEEIKKLFPNTYGMPLVEFVTAENALQKEMNVGVILSGGQAPGAYVRS